MNQNSVKKVLHAILRPIVQGLIIFAVFGLGLYAYAITYPPQPGPVSGIFGQLVGFTASPINGSQGGYKLASDLCNTAFSGSHVCVAEEITRSYVSQNPAITTATTNANGAWNTPTMYFAWIDNGPPGYTGTLSNDCGGWTQPSATYYGSIWDMKGKNFVINTCDNMRRFACCL